MSASEGLKAELLALEERLLDPAVRAVPALVRELLAPEFTEFGASGRVFNRDAILATLASEPPRVAMFSLSVPGTPSSGDSGAPASQRVWLARAWASAASGS